MKEGFNPYPDKKKGIVDFQRITDYIKQGQQLNKEAGVGQKEATWMTMGEYEELPYMFLFMTDVHYGHSGVDYDMLNEHLSIVAETPNMGVVFGGDLVDNFSPKVLPQGMLGDIVSPQLQARAMMEVLTSLDRQLKIGAISWGNHDDFIEAAGYSFYDTWMRDLQAPILDTGGAINVVVNGGERYRIALTHKFWGNSKKNQTNAAKNLILHEYPEADISIIGHTHQAAGEQYHLGGKDRISVVGGTYKMKDTYGERNFGRAGKPGFTIALWPDQHKMELFRDPRVAQNWMLEQIITHQHGK